MPRSFLVKTTERTRYALSTINIYPASPSSSSSSSSSSSAFTSLYRWRGGKVKARDGIVPAHQELIVSTISDSGHTLTTLTKNKSYADKMTLAQGDQLLLSLNEMTSAENEAGGFLEELTFTCRPADSLLATSHPLGLRPSTVCDVISQSTSNPSSPQDPPNSNSDTLTSHRDTSNSNSDTPTSSQDTSNSNSDTPTSSRDTSNSNSDTATSSRYKSNYQKNNANYCSTLYNSLEAAQMAIEDEDDIRMKSCENFKKFCEEHHCSGACDWIGDDRSDSISGGNSSDDKSSIISRGTSSDDRSDSISRGTNDVVRSYPYLPKLWMFDRQTDDTSTMFRTTDTTNYQQNTSTRYDIVTCQTLLNTGRNLLCSSSSSPPSSPPSSLSSTSSSTSSGSEEGSARRQIYTCEECGRHYATSSNLSRHKQTHRSLDSQHAKQCPHCRKLYVSMPALSMHILTHDLKYTCTVCSKAFSRPWLLRGHQRSHTGERPYSCSQCGKSFADRSNLRAHAQTHSVFKQWRCERCAKTFALKSYLNKHCELACGGAGGGGGGGRGGGGGSGVGDGGGVGGGVVGGGVGEGGGGGGGGIIGWGGVGAVGGNEGVVEAGATSKRGRVGGRDMLSLYA